MSSPVGHLLFGILLLPAAQNANYDFRKRIIFFSICLSCTLFPDLDFFPGIFLGDVNRFHQGISHSLLGGLLVSASLAGFFVWRYKGSFLKVGMIFYLFYFSHLFLDLMLMDRSEPYGIPLFIPFSETRFQFPIQFLPGIDRAQEPDRFITSLFSVNNFKAVIIEIGIFGSILILSNFFRNHKPVLFLNSREKSKNEKNEGGNN